MASLPSLDDLDFTRVDLTGVDLTRVNLAALAGSEPARAALAAIDLSARLVRESAYVTVGLTVLGIQRLQVRRREFERSLRR